MTVPSYGSLPPLSGQEHAKKRIGVLAVFGVLAATAALVAVTLSSVAGRAVLLEQKRGGNLVSSVEHIFSDDARQQLSDSMIDPDRAGYADGMTGARLDRVSATALAEEKKEEEAKEERIPDPLDKAGIAVDHWPWDAAPPVIGSKEEGDQDSAEKASMVESLMGAFQDKAHSNPLLSKQQLRELQREQHVQRAEQAARREAAQRLQEERAAQQAAQQRKMQVSEEKAAALSRRRHRRDEEAEAEAEEEEHARAAAAAAAQAAKRRSAREEAEREAAAVQARVLRKTRAAAKDPRWRAAEEQERLGQSLAAEAAELRRMQKRGGGGADGEEEQAAQLQAAAFGLEKLATEQRLEEEREEGAEEKKKKAAKPDLEGGRGLSAWSKEDVLGKDFDWSLQLFPAWYWTEDSAQGLEARRGRAAAAAKAGRAQRAWERGAAGRLAADGRDMSQLAQADAQKGLFHGQVLEEAAEAGDTNATETEGGGERCNKDTPGCHKLDKIGVPVDHWPWAEARAKREWERRVARQVGAAAASVEGAARSELQRLRLQAAGVAGAASRTGA